MKIRSHKYADMAVDKEREYNEILLLLLSVYNSYDDDTKMRVQRKLYDNNIIFPIISVTQ